MILFTMDPNLPQKPNMKGKNGSDGDFRIVSFETTIRIISGYQRDQSIALVRLSGTMINLRIGKGHLCCCRLLQELILFQDL